MMRFSRNTLFLIKNVVPPKSALFVNCKKNTAIVQLPYHLIEKSFYSTETVTGQKSTASLSKLIAKDAVDNTTEKADEEEAKKQREKSWRTMKLTLAFFGISFTCLGGYLVFTLGAPEKDENGIPITDDYSDRSLMVQYILRTYAELDYYRRLIKEPSREKLLPDPLEYPYLQPKYTLVLELTDILVHPDWTYKTGWRFKKRPMLDYFLETLHGHYEIVVYTAEQGMTVFPLIEAIDPKNIIAYKLVRDATHFSGGQHVKSLNNINRDLSKVICIDWNPKNVKFNPENLLCVKRWNGADNDTSLYDLATLLKAIAENEIEDVRDVLKHYKKYDDPIEGFRQKQKRYIEYMDAQLAAKREEEKSKYSRWTPSFLKKSF